VSGTEVGIQVLLTLVLGMLILSILSFFRRRMRKM